MERVSRAVPWVVSRQKQVDGGSKSRRGILEARVQVLGLGGGAAFCCKTADAQKGSARG